MNQGVTPIGERAGEAVGIACGDGGDFHGSPRTIGGTVTDGFPFGDLPNQKNSRFPRENRLEFYSGTGQGVDSVEAQSRSRMGSGRRQASQDGGGIGPVVGQKFG